MRVYEWGPEDGDKVLFVHGDSTPAPILAPIAHNLAKKRCGIMMFGMWTRLASKPRATMGRPCKRVHCADQVYVKDLWGRGYSDTPVGVPHDARLYGMQIFFSTASSSLPWTGAESGGFSVVAFSLRAGIAMAFAADFYYLISSIILLAPVGIIRRLPAEYENMLFRYPSLLPSSCLRTLVRKLLGLKVSGFNVGHSGLHNQNQIVAEMAQGLKTMRSRALDIPGILQWQFDNQRSHP